MFTKCEIMPSQNVNPMHAMTHEDLTAQKLLDELPAEARATLQTEAVRRRVSIAALLKEGLLAIAREINAAAAGPAGARPAQYSNANAA